MRLIALIAFKDEEWILPTYLSSIVSVVDEIIALDDGSTDASRRLIEEAGGHVVAGERLSRTDAPPPDGQDGVQGSGHAGQSFMDARTRLLELGRARGGTHFISLDADEALTAPGRAHLRDALAGLKPGSKLAMQWVTLWKRPDRYRHDRSVWTNLFKDFAWADREGMGQVGAARTPGQNDETDWVRLGAERGAVLHYQFVPWWRAQIKQAWYRCAELIERPTDAYWINATYSTSVDNRWAKTRAIPPSWLDGIEVAASLTEQPPGWHLQAIANWFTEYGVEFFEPLQIWHIPQLHAMFTAATAREPRPQLHLPFIPRARSIVASRMDVLRRLLKLPM